MLTHQARDPGPRFLTGPAGELRGSERVRLWGRAGGSPAAHSAWVGPGHPPLTARLAQASSSSVQPTEQRVTTSEQVGPGSGGRKPHSKQCPLPEVRQGGGEATFGLSGMDLPCERGAVSFPWSSLVSPHP